MAVVPRASWPRSWSAAAWRTRAWPSAAGKLFSEGLESAVAEIAEPVGLRSHAWPASLHRHGGHARGHRHRRRGAGDGVAALQLGLDVALDKPTAEALDKPVVPSQ